MALFHLHKGFVLTLVIAQYLFVYSCEQGDRDKGDDGVTEKSSVASTTAAESIGYDADGVVRNEELGIEVTLRKRTLSEPAAEVTLESMVRSRSEIESSGYVTLGGGARFDIRDSSGNSFTEDKVVANYDVTFTKIDLVGVDHSRVRILAYPSAGAVTVKSGADLTVTENGANSSVQFQSKLPVADFVVVLAAAASGGGSGPNYLFVTARSTISGSEASPGGNGFDDICQTAGDNSTKFGPGTTWRAAISRDGSTMRQVLEGLEVSGPILDTLDRTIANDVASLFTVTIQNDFNFDENGGTVTLSDRALTGTTWQGNLGDNCSSWTGSGSVTAGNAGNRTNGAWMEYGGSATCSTGSFHIYCIQMDH